MAALVEGQQYGLSSQGNYSNNKSLIFVKLTDSALKAIGELVKLGQKQSMCPTIQFQGNQGVISLPRPPATNSEYVQEFGFTLSNVEADGPQGSFECIQQSGSRSLHSLGCMFHKMHIHANEDSYEKTRVKMASVEKESKMNCTKVIKASGPYVGRKVKVKRPPFIPPPKSSTPPPVVPKPIPKPMSHMPTSNSLLGNNSSSSSGTTSANQQQQQPSLRPVVSPNAGSSNHQQASFKPVVNSVSPPNGHHPPLASNSTSLTSTSSNNPGSTTTSTSCAPGKSSSGNPDIMRRSYKERVVHLLALRSYKKPELLARLMKDGIKEKDKKGLSVLLSKVAIPKGNTFSLARYCWNEVQDDWPFYTQEEKELLKRRRTQIASPPVENDPPSPSAIHSSQPPIPNPPSKNSQKPSSKRPHPAVLQGKEYDIQQQPKKLRISHYNSRAGESNPFTSRENGYRESNKDNNRLGDSMPLHFSSAKSSERVSGAGTSSNSGVGTNRSSPLNGLFRTDSPSRSSPINRTNSQQTSGHQKSLSSGFTNYEHKNSHQDGPPYRSGGSLMSTSGGGGGKMRRPRMAATTNAGSTGSRGSSPQSSPESQDSVEYRGSSSLNSSPTPEVPSYVTKYVEIVNRDQRAKYKADFNAEYSEYRKLHAIIEQVKRRFETLETELRKSPPGSEEWHRTKSQILLEYEENHRGHQYRETKRRLNYLHDKLSHIKRLVVEYDQEQSEQQQQQAIHNTVGRHEPHHLANNPSQQRHRQQLAMA